MEQELNNDKGLNIHEMAHTLLIRVDEAYTFTEAQRNSFVELVGRFAAAYEGELREGWEHDIFGMMGDAGREDYQGMVETLNECIQNGGFYYGVEPAYKAMLDYINVNRSVYPYRLPHLDETQRAELKDLVEGACEASGGRISRSWRLAFTYILPYPFPNDDIYPEFVKVLQHFAEHGGLQGEYPQDIQAAYEGTPASEDEDLQKIRIARSVAEMLEDFPEMLTDEVRTLLGITANRGIYERMMEAFQRSEKIGKSLNTDKIRRGEFNQMDVQLLHFCSELLRLCISGTNPEGAFVWLSITDNLREHIEDGWFEKLDPMGIDDNMFRWFNLWVEDPQDAEHVINRWGQLITNELSRIAGHSVELEIWDVNDNVWALKYLVA